MHDATVNRISHSHRTGTIDSNSERRTFQVVLLTLVTMAVEIAAGYATGSMALLADGWHMGTHAFALGVSYVGYRLARRYADSDGFSFGTGKISVLAGYTSAIFLGLAAVWMIVESLDRLFHPVDIAFNEAIVVTIIGLSVNLISVLILRDSGIHHHHEHSSEHDHQTHTHHHDHNYRAAYLHVLADALTSVLAIVALLSGRFLGWWFMDPLMGLAGGFLIIRWAHLLIKNTATILVDGAAGDEIKQKIREAVESDQDSRIADLHVWRIGSNEIAVIVSVVTGQDRKPEEYQARIEKISGLMHLSVEVHSCETPNCLCSALP